MVTVQMLIDCLQLHNPDKEVVFRHKMHGKIMPDQIEVPISKIETVSDKVVLSNQYE